MSSTDANIPTPKQTPREAIYIGVFADPHYAPDRQYGDRYCRDGLRKIEHATNTFNAFTPDIACMVCLGDLVDGEITPGDARAAGTTAARFDGPRYLVMGNHDMDTLTKAELLAAANFTNTASVASFDIDWLRCIILDANYHSDGHDFAPGDNPWMECHINVEQVAWLDDQLADAAANDMQAVLFCHPQLDQHQTPKGPAPNVVINHQAVRDVIDRHGNVLAAIHGHEHRGAAALIGSTAYITLRGMCSGPWPDVNAMGVLGLHPTGDVTLEGFGQQPSVMFKGNAS